MGFFSKLKQGLEKTRKGFVEKVVELVTGVKKIDDELYEQLEEILVQSDLGVTTSVDLVEKLRAEVKARKISDPQQLKDIMKELIGDILGQEGRPLNLKHGDLTIIMVVGVNGVGKTTTIGKLAQKFKQEGKKVILAAGDTFRAAAIDQLEIWSQRVGVEIVHHQEGSDPAAVVYDAIVAARSRKMDVLIIDTAGRLHTKSNLMEELKKVFRVIQREVPDAPHEVLLVLDATTGQNALNQARIFKDAVAVTGVVLTKLDGTAKGGMVVSIARELGIPVKLIGIGEKAEDLREFEPQEFTDALFDLDLE